MGPANEHWVSARTEEVRSTVTTLDLQCQISTGSLQQREIKFPQDTELSLAKSGKDEEGVHGDSVGAGDRLQKVAF